jgi:hypothetical protein
MRLDVPGAPLPHRRAAGSPGGREQRRNRSERPSQRRAPPPIAVKATASRLATLGPKRADPDSAGRFRSSAADAGCAGSARASPATCTPQTDGPDTHATPTRSVRGATRRSSTGHPTTAERPAIAPNASHPDGRREYRRVHSASKRLENALLRAHGPPRKTPIPTSMRDYAIYPHTAGSTGVTCHARAHGFASHRPFLTPENDNHANRQPPAINTARVRKTTSPPCWRGSTIHVTHSDCNARTPGTDLLRSRAPRRGPAWWTSGSR